jgi:hypothetical protein
MNVSPRAVVALNVIASVTLIVGLAFYQHWI